MVIDLVSLWGNGIAVTDQAKVDSSIVVRRPWGYEVRADYANGKSIINEVLTFPKEPDAKEIADAAEDRRLALDQQYTVTKDSAKVAQLEERLRRQQSELDMLVAAKLATEAEISTEKAKPVEEIPVEIDSGLAEELGK